MRFIRQDEERLKWLVWQSFLLLFRDEVLINDGKWQKLVVKILKHFGDCGIIMSNKAG